MRPIPPGYQATFAVTVTPEMTVDFEELGRVHPVYATYWMAKHMELVGRKIILPFLEPGEDGIGYEVHVRHLAPALPGAELRFVAEHVRTEGNRVHARCVAYNPWDERIGEGETTQVVLPAEVIAARIEALRRRSAADDDGRSVWSSS